MKCWDNIGVGVLWVGHMRCPLWIAGPHRQ